MNEQTAHPTRRKFLVSTASAVTGLASSGHAAPRTHDGTAASPGKIRKISQAGSPLAITMVDYSWMLKHHRYGAYADFDRFFAELVERSYNEGWGAVFWEDNPTIDWRFIKEAAEISVPLAAKHGYQFICTSNFTCPHFQGMWEDVAWHQDMTGVIKSG